MNDPFGNTVEITGWHIREESLKREMSLYSKEELKRAFIFGYGSGQIDRDNGEDDVELAWIRYIKEYDD